MTSRKPCIALPNELHTDVITQKRAIQFNQKEGIQFFIIFRTVADFFPKKHESFLALHKNPNLIYI